MASILAQSGAQAELSYSWRTIRYQSVESKFNNDDPELSIISFFFDVDLDADDGYIKKIDETNELHFLIICSDAVPN
ncbi:hypothetical protein F2Q69_00029708 [Brassica cretica]|uniref:Uncharacterized protein n=1 Tax=Brassica cretica TaxID=69181 RepID=A0A8S9RTN1_BRACR|nr:hypothetical protein F2Q69_00029708 [Brassica cretica]